MRRCQKLALLCAGAGYGLAKKMTPRYESFVHLALREPDDPGGVSPDNRRAPEVRLSVPAGKTR